MEPPTKQQKTEDNDLKEILLNMQVTFINKLKTIEKKIDKISSRYHVLGERVENVLLKIKESSLKEVISLPTSVEGKAPTHTFPNTEDSYPDGCWLGNPNDPDLRVRCGITPLELEDINSSCTTPEKMSLTLLDHLFDRETQAVSNISGTGKHGKRQLDPLKIYGIKCHVTYMFGISNVHWQRIKQNIDSKCRTAFRRKHKGMPLICKGVKERHLSLGKPKNLKSCNSKHLPLVEKQEHENLTSPGKEPHSYESLHENDFFVSLNADFTESLNQTQIIHTEHGDFQVIQATEEELEQLKKNHEIEILTEDVLLNDQLSNG
ncbi:protein BANP-like [Uloborus diversus]|uniref:protein BANP-like n=1 Tax=Uloborus diversus TaxID=327109 RepID=UPI002409779D|nr:protein BANP-like [Uloborus diversus]